jgi:hypothetical protein
MSQLARLLNEYAVPLQIWLTPGARVAVADPLIAAMGNAAEIHTNPLSAMDELTGPAVLVITAAEIRSPQPDALKALSRAAHPGKAVLVGGTADRDTLMTAINDWGVIRVIPTNPDTATLVGAVRDAEATLKREVALVTAIDDLDIETTMLTSAIDHIEDSQDGSSRRSRTQATATFALGLSSLLEREHACLQRELPHLEGDHLSAIEGALEGIVLLGGIVDEAHDRAIESGAGMTPTPVCADTVLGSVRTLLKLSTGQAIGGHLGSGTMLGVDPLALITLLLHLGSHTPLGTVSDIESYRSGDALIIECRYAIELTDTADLTDISAWMHLSQAGAQMTRTPGDPYILRLILPDGNTPNA